MRLGLALYFVCFISHAECSVLDEQFDKWNKLYSHLFQIEKNLINNNFSVIASLPTEIEGLSFGSATIFRDSLDEPSFFTTLKVHKDSGVFTVWFTINAKSKEKFFLNFGYGKDCGLEVSLPFTVN